MAPRSWEAAGLLAEERDVDGLAACLTRLLDRPQRWYDMTANARHRIEQEFDAAQQGRRLTRIYEEVVAREADHGGGAPYE